MTVFLIILWGCVAGAIALIAGIWWLEEREANTAGEW